MYECEKGGTAEEIEEGLIASIRHYGIPDEFCTDGGSQYTSERLTNLLERYKIEQKTSSPYHARGNQHAEQSVKAAKKALSGWGKHKHKSKAFREKWILDRMAGKNNKRQVDNGRAPNELILGRKEKEENILDTDYMDHKKENMLTPKELKEKMKKKRRKTKRGKGGRGRGKRARKGREERGKGQERRKRKEITSRFSSQCVSRTGSSKHHVRCHLIKTRNHP